METKVSRARGAGEGDRWRERPGVFFLLLTAVELGITFLKIDA